MKKTLFTALLLLSIQSAVAQAPQGFTYQAVIRNTSNSLVSNAPVGVRISVLQGSISGSSVYTETHTSNTNSNGLLTLIIGNGSVVNGSFAAINWGNGPYFIQTETDPNGGTNYTVTGTTQLMSVPYALYAENSANPGPQGPQGISGNDGIDGNDGLSAYQIWLSLGNTGTSADFIASLTGPQGPQGVQGPVGASGAQGPAGATGASGVGIVSTVNNGNGTFTLNYSDGSSFTTSNLTGPTGAAGATGAIGPQGPQGIQGPAGATGPQGPAGTAGAAGVGIVSTVNNGNGTFTLNYSDGSSFTTSNLTGPTGVTGATGATGPQGPQGIQGPIGVTGATGPQGLQGVPGNDGSNGLNSLVKTTLEGPSMNCFTGGVKYEFGLDANNNGILDVSEINATQTKYVCNGKNAISRTTPEAAGANCSEGGVKLELGTDLDGDSYLDAVEVSSVQYICNGVQGVTGPQGPAGPAGANPTDIGFRAYKTVTESQSASTKVTFGATQFNDGNGWNLATSSFTVPVAGLYQFISTLNPQGLPQYSNFYPVLRINGVYSRWGHHYFLNYFPYQYTFLVKLNAGDVVELYYEGTNTGMYGHTNPVFAPTCFEGFKVN